MAHLLKNLLPLIVISFLFSCSGKHNLEVAGTSWMLEEMPGGVPQGVEINLLFDEDKISGKGVCNRYFSDYQREENTISFQIIGSTKMLCPEHSEAEDRYFQLLQTANKLAVNHDQLSLTTPEGDLVFNRAIIEE